MGWTVHVVPPSAVAMTAAPFGVPAPPALEPTAQHREELTQSRALRELTGAGRVTGPSVPDHGEPGAMEDRALESSVVPPLEQAVATTATRAVDAHAPARRARDRPRAGALVKKRVEISGP